MEDVGDGLTLTADRVWRSTSGPLEMDLDKHRVGIDAQSPPDCQTAVVCGGER